ncbi:MAG: Smr/MutS family protein [Pleomorphochaeta sp.]
MARKGKKSPQNRQNAAGNSRISVMSDEEDTYNPFKDIKKINAVTKINTSEKSKTVKNKSKNNNLIIEDLGDVSFAQVFEQWENGGVVNKKSIDKQDGKSEDFSAIFEQWEISQGLKPKYGKKVKDNPNRKSSNYSPTKDFGQILNEFEKGPQKSPSKKQKTKNKEKFDAKKVETEVVNIDVEDKEKPSKEKKIIKENRVDIAWPMDNSKDVFVSENKEIVIELENENENELERNTAQKYYKKNKWKDQDDENSKKAKWDFSDIYNSWEAKHDDSKLIEEKKIREKKESKGISISYLRSMSPEAELDLHGETSDIAALKVSEFLNNSRNRGLKKVSIITGKGLHSENGKPVLKDIVLEEIRCSNIVREAYHPKAISGGSGVIWVIFKSISEKKIYY